MKYSNSHKLRLYPSKMTANLTNTKYQVLPLVLEKLLGWNIANQDWILMWCDQAVSIDQVKSLSKNQRINHFPGMFELSRKNRLARNLNAMRKLFPKDYDFYPETWVLPLEYNQLQQHHLENPSSIYIVKPESGCQGRGIFLTNNISQLQRTRGYIVQKYIQKPYLIDNLKFDFRIYVLVTCVNPLRIYVFDQGLARFATEQFEPADNSNLKRTYTHLTNYSINKDNSNFQFSDEDFSVGHKRSLKSTLSKINDPTLNDRIYNIIVKTLIAGQPQLISHYKSAQSHNINSCFEILGFDILLDHKLNPYLLEINHTPSFNIDTNLDKKVKVDLLLNTIRMVCRDNVHKDLDQQQTNRKYKYQYMSSMLDYQVKQKDIHQMKNLGRFQKIYPQADQTHNYEQFIKASNDIFHKKYGTNIVRRTKKVFQSQQQPDFAPKLNLHSDLQKVYKRNKLKPLKNTRTTIIKRSAEDANIQVKNRSNFLKNRAFQIYSNKTSIYNFRSASSNAGH